MTTLLRCITHCPKTLSSIYTSIPLTSHYSFYHANCNSPCNKSPPKQNVLKFNPIYRPTLPTRNVWHKNMFSVDFFQVQRRHFSLRDTFESAVTTHTSVFKTISESSVVQYTQHFIVNLHDATGLPWWLSIIVVTCLVRCFITLPLALYQSYVIARLENIRKEMDEIANDLRYDLDREIRKNRLSEKNARSHLFAATRKEWKRLIERDNCHPAKASILAIIQIPTWIVFSTSFRNLVYMLPHQDAGNEAQLDVLKVFVLAAAAVTRLGLSLGGLPWCTDLTVPDTFVIPITLALTNLVIVEVQAMMHLEQSTRLRRYLSNFFRGFAIFMIPVAATVPSAVSLYWLTSSVFGLCQNLLVASPRVRRLCNFPPSASFNPHPYTHLAQKIKSKFRS